MVLTTPLKKKARPQATPSTINTIASVVPYCKYRNKHTYI